ncbi:2'-5' RNA ligase family protein [Arthrobacter sp. ov407]|uniref:2'-5' RNA ligase family protein n=1 Tax=Arthrobacter sp. ov407 TaxID=1761748 RepID=UPI000B8813BE|nr:2'-5' RNA ligase family protein [Arthrobacter sp. ov407]
MRNLIAVAFVEPVAEGLEFPRDDWPLHLTLLKFDVAKFDVGKFDVVEPRQESGAEPEPGTPPAPGDPLAERIATLMADTVAAALGCRVSVDGEAGFGRAGSIPVNLIEPSEQLQLLHNELVRIVEQLPGRISTPTYTLEGYRPHVSHHGAKRLQQGDTFALDRIALVDMAPDGGHATRRILKLWTGAPA